MRGPPSHQTVRLSVGRHADPADGACVIELASMLAGEEFTDRPACVCPVIAAFGRTYNDLVEDGLRRDLLPYAAAVVGTRADTTVMVARAHRALAFAIEEWQRLPWLRRLLPGPKLPTLPVLGRLEEAGSRAARAVPRDDAGHRRALALLDELIEIGAPAPLGLPRCGPPVAAPPLRPADARPRS